MSAFIQPRTIPVKCARSPYAESSLSVWISSCKISQLQPIAEPAAHQSEECSCSRVLDSEAVPQDSDTFCLNATTELELRNPVDVKAKNNSYYNT